MKSIYQLSFYILFVFANFKSAFSQQQYFDVESLDTVLLSGEFKLKSILKIPKEASNFPCVIFLNGSGPIDREGTIGPNKITLNILTELAKYGIAGFAFDKRTVEYSNKIFKKYDSFTVKDEYVDDALEALKFILSLKNVNKKRIFLIGHSEGGMIAPYIYQLSKNNIQGLILLATSPKDLEELISYQYEYLLSLDSNSKIIKAQFLSFQNSVKNLPKVYQGIYIPRDSLPFGLPANYWRSLKETSISKYLPLAKCPILILQGKRDYQVITKDYEKLLQLVTNNQKVKSFLLDSLNHLFIPGAGKPSPLEYSFSGKVSQKAIEDIASFVKEN